MDTAVLIPAYHPDENLLKMLKSLQQSGRDFLPVIIDDGSGETFDPIFRKAEAYGPILRHESNQGKGAALKTGIAFVKESMPDVRYIITADADGQHLTADICRLADALREKDGFVIGARKFEGKVPLRSRFGNGITKLVFLVAAGKKCSDTQTGLRGFSSDLFDFMLNVRGNRYEYEMNVLMQCAQGGVPIREIPIRTVYEGGKNQSSHFRPIKDSFRIYRTIFAASSLVRYGLTAVACFLLDFGAIFFFKNLVTQQEWLYTLLARCVSAPVNYLLNRLFVFHSNADKLKSFLSYVALAGCVILAKMGLMELLAAPLGTGWADILIETVLFISNFIIQKLFIFRKKKKL